VSSWWVLDGPVPDYITFSACFFLFSGIPFKGANLRFSYR